MQQYSQFLRSRQFAELGTDLVEQVIRRNEVAEREESNRRAREEAAARGDGAGGMDGVLGSSLSDGGMDGGGSGGGSVPLLSASALREKQHQMWTSVSLDLVLHDPLALSRLKQFATRLRCAENIAFFFAAEEYRYIPSDSYLRVIANKIVQTYIRNAKSVTAWMHARPQTRTSSLARGSSR